MGGGVLRLVRKDKLGRWRSFLFAETIKASFEKGIMDSLAFSQKQTSSLITRRIGARVIAGDRHMTLDERAAKKLYERYYGNKS